MIKNMIFILVAIVMTYSLSAVSYSEESDNALNKMTGKILRAEGAFVLVIDKAGRTHKFHLDETTLLNGEIRVGELVVVESSDNGHAVSISTHHLKKSSRTETGKNPKETSEIFKNST